MKGNGFIEEDHTRPLRSQRGRGAFLTGPNAAKYSDPKLPTRGRPPKKQKLFLTTINEDGLGNVAEEVGIQSASLQLQPLVANNEHTPVTRNGTLTRESEMRDADNSDGGEQSPRQRQ